ncbi:hypothetical protein HX792_27675 [Pseudomonas sp. B6002]|uniref:hypothetical protein n=1 Tax=Pseudomonas sp. B6002 TaxID=2726978 RepID=UPI00159FE840|nr:hypothetical protein [Pseudomonas sp. B6002]NVZ54137.1 hypothetical protein [Pseudomonas sp. B6002]
MNILITAAIPADDGLSVSFHSPAGSGTGTWMGITPKIGDELDVEFDLEEVFSLGKNLMPSSRKTPSITVENKVTYITAELIQDEDGEYTALKFGDSIILIELDEPLTQKVGFVEVTASRIRLYPTNT